MYANKKSYDKLKDSFYGWEYSVENDLSPVIAQEEINLLQNLFFAYEDLQLEYKKMKEALKWIEEFSVDYQSITRARDALPGGEVK